MKIYKNRNVKDEAYYNLGEKTVDNSDAFINHHHIYYSRSEAHRKQSRAVHLITAKNPCADVCQSGWARNPYSEMPVTAINTITVKDMQHH